MFTMAVEIFELLNTEPQRGPGNTAEALVAHDPQLFRVGESTTNH